MKNSIILMLLITSCSSPVKNNIKYIKSDLQQATAIIDNTKKVIAESGKRALDKNNKDDVLLFSNLENNINDVKLLVNNAELKANHLESLYINEIKSLKIKVIIYKTLLILYTIILVIILKSYFKSNTLKINLFKK